MKSSKYIFLTSSSGNIGQDRILDDGLADKLSSQYLVIRCEGCHEDEERLFFLTNSPGASNELVKETWGRPRRKFQEHGDMTAVLRVERGGAQIDIDGHDHDVIQRVIKSLEKNGSIVRFDG